MPRMDTNNLKLDETSAMPESWWQLATNEPKSGDVAAMRIVSMATSFDDVPASARHSSFTLDAHSAVVTSGWMRRVGTATSSAISACRNSSSFMSDSSMRVVVEVRARAATGLSDAVEVRGVARFLVPRRSVSADNFSLADDLLLSLADARIGDRGEGGATVVVVRTARFTRMVPLSVGQSPRVACSSSAANLTASASRRMTRSARITCVRTCDAMMQFCTVSFDTMQRGARNRLTLKMKRKSRRTPSADSPLSLAC
mmetsp:Transcript_15244/g.47573  ORF Transcript_15244/g.47573 Transcript_15244/m.47573 type:complete len:257 (-) Transcript_15244:1606-2376(-)